MLHDPIEDDPRFRDAIQAAAREAAAELANEKPGLGICHMLWATQKHILKEKYEIEWKTLAEMNPDMDID